MHKPLLYIGLTCLLLGVALALGTLWVWALVGVSANVGFAAALTSVFLAFAGLISYEASNGRV